MKTALILEGGALRGLFSSGVIDYFIDQDFKFDYVIGVSAGACLAFQYLSKTRGYLKRAYFEGKEDKDPFFGVGEFIETGSFINLDKVFYDYVDKYAFDVNTFKKNLTPWHMVVTNIEEGKAEYLHSDDFEKARLIGKASCSIPLLTEPVEIDSKLYLDGGIADSIPIQKAIDQGYDKLVIVLTRKKGNYSGVSKAEMIAMNSIYKEYPNFLQTCKNRREMYMNEVELAEKLEKEGKAIIIRPTMEEVKRLENDEETLSLAYYHGFTKAREYKEKIKEFLGEEK